MGKIFSAGQDKTDTVAAIPAACADEMAALEFLEQARWGDSPCCALCGSVNVYKMLSRGDRKRIPPFRWRCLDCKQRYTVRTDTVLEDSAVPLRHWCYAFWAASASKKGVSALQIKRQTGLSYKTALFLMHRIRLAMAMDHDPGVKLSGTVEADETYVGGKPRYKYMGRKMSYWDRAPVFAAVERGGEVRAVALTHVNANNLREALDRTVSKESRLITDDSKLYVKPGRQYKGGHYTVRHSVNEYVRGDIHSNTIESFFAILKRGVYGTWHAVSPKHLHRYVAETEFRYNHRRIDDGARTLAAIRGAEGKRLTYREQAAPVRVKQR